MTTRVLLVGQCSSKIASLSPRLWPRYGALDASEHGSHQLTRAPKIEGKLETTSSEAGSQCTILVDDKYTLWSKKSSQPSGSTCPGQIPFAFLLPTKRKDSEAEGLPPTYEINGGGNHALYMRTSYRVSFIITRSVYQKMRWWTKKKRYASRFCSPSNYSSPFQHSHPIQLCPSNKAPSPDIRSPVLLFLDQDVARRMVSSSRDGRDSVGFESPTHRSPCQFARSFPPSPGCLSCC